MIGALPPLRSTLSRGQDSPDAWCSQVIGHLDELRSDLISSGKKDPKLEMKLKIFRDSFSGGRLNNGGLRVRKSNSCSGRVDIQDLDSW